MGALSPQRFTDDLLLGGNSTASAKFAFIGNAGSATPVASISAGTPGGVYLSANGTLATTAKQSLTLGDANTGNILLGQNIAAATKNISNVGTLDLGTGNISLNGNTITSGSTTLTIATATTLSDTGLATFTTANNLSMGSTTGLTLGGNATIYGGTAASSTLTLAGTSSVSPSNANILLNATGQGAVGIGTATPLGTLDIRGNSGTTPAATVSATSTFAAFDVNQNGTGDLFVASKSGATKFVINNNGDIQFGGGTSNLLTLAFAGGGNPTITFPNATGTVCLQSSASCGFLTGTNYWQSQTTGAIEPFNTTYDLLLGGSATTSAKFAFTGNAGTANPVASISAQTGAGSNGLVLSSGSIQSLSNSTLNIGGNTTGDIAFQPGNQAVGNSLYLASNGNVGIGAAVPGGKLDIEYNDSSANGTAGLKIGNLAAGGGSWYFRAGATGTNTLPGGFSLANNSNYWLNISQFGNFGIGANTNANLGNAQLVVNQANNAGDIFTASQAGTPKFTIANNGNIAATGVLSGLTGLTLASGPITLGGVTGSASTCITGGATAAWGSCGVTSTYWQLNSNVLSPGNSAFDLTLGGSSTSSAKFAFIGNAGTANPVASISAQTGAGSNGLVLSPGSIQSLSNNTLTIGGNTTGDIAFQPGGKSVGTSLYLASSGNVGIGTTTPGSPLVVSGIASNVNNGQIVGIYGNLTSSSNSQTGLYSSPLASPSANSIQAYIGGDFVPQITNTTFLTNASVYGIQAAPYDAGTGTLGNAFAGNFQNYIAASGTITNSVGVFINNPNVSGGGIITNNTGLYIANQISGGSYNSNLSIAGNPAGGNYSLYDASTYNNYFAGSLGIGATSPLAALDVRGNVATNPTASISGATTFAEAVVDQSGLGDLFTASKSGATKFVITNAGNVGIGTSTPNTQLQVNGTASTYGSGTNTGFLVEDSASGSYAGRFMYDSSALGLSNDLRIRLGGNSNPSGFGISNYDTAMNIWDPLTGGLGVGATNLLGTLDVRAGGNTSNGGTIAVASVSGQTSFASLLVDQSGNGDLFTASKSGATKFTILNNGNIAATGVLSGLTGLTLASGPITLQGSTGTTSTCLIGGATNATWGACGGASSNYWQLNSNVLSPGNSAFDLTLGGSSTSSAKFAFIGTAGTANPVASISAQTGAGSNGLVLSSGSIQSLSNNTLTIGGATTGNISIMPGNGSGNVGIGTNSPLTELNLNKGGTANADQLLIGNYTTKGLELEDTGASVDLGSYGVPLYINNLAAQNTYINPADGGFVAIGNSSPGNGQLVVNQPNAGGDIFSASQSGNTKFVISNSGNVGIGTTTPGGMLSVASANTGNVTGGLSTWGNSFSLFGPNAGSATGTALALGYDTTDNTAVIDSGTPGSSWNSLELLSSTFSVLTNNIQGLYQSASGSVGIGTVSPLATLDVRGNVATTPVASLSGATTFAAFDVNQNGTGDLFTASKSGATKFVINNAGNVGIGIANPVYPLYVNSAANNIQAMFQSTGSTRADIDINENGGSQQAIMQFDDQGNVKWQIGKNTDQSFFIWDNVNGNTRLYMPPAANSGTEFGGAGAIGNDALVVNQANAQGDIFSASQAGTTKFVISNNGNIQFTGGNSTALTTFTTSGISQAQTITIPNTSGAGGTLCLSTNNCGYTAGTNYWQSLTTGAIEPFNTTYDLLLGGSATTSAKFAFTGNAGTANPVASISAQTGAGSNGLVLSSGSIQSLSNNTLTLGGTTTGNISLMPGNGSGNVGIGTTTPAYPLDIEENAAGAGNNAILNIGSNSHMLFTTGQQYGIFSQPTAAPGGVSTTVYTGGVFDPHVY